jgi:hypothetical protein|tara:strand:- start:1016 stop:1141 length:126 start_codon:yes stop_codon:yes gene_type:complete
MTESMPEIKRCADTTFLLNETKWMSERFVHITEAKRQQEHG